MVLPLLLQQTLDQLAATGSIDVLGVAETTVIGAATGMAAGILGAGAGLLDELGPLLDRPRRI